MNQQVLTLVLKVKQMLQKLKYQLWIPRMTKSRYFMISMVVFLIIFILSPYAMNGFWGDDALNSQVSFGLDRVHGNLWDLSFRVFWYWLTVEGRLMAGFLHGYALFYFFSDLLSLRLAQCFTVALNIGLFSYILYCLGFKRNVLLAWAIILVGLFQIRGALDPIAAFAFHYQILAIQLFLPLIILIKWSTDLRSRYLIFAMILWFWSMMYYEINVIFLFIVLVFILKSRQDRRKVTQNLFIVAVPVFVYALVNYYLRSHATGGSYEGSSFGRVDLFFTAYLKQLTSSLPLSFYLAQGNKVIGFFDLLSIGFHSKLAWAILVLAAIIFYKITECIKNELDFIDAKFEVFIISIAMLLLPPILPAISARYQLEVDWGLGTLPVYYQYFGASLFLVWMFSGIIKHNRMARLLLSLIVGLYLSLNTMVNMEIVNRLDSDYYREPRSLFISQSHDGLFQDVKDGDIVEIKDTPHYVNANLIFQGCGKNVFVPSGDHNWFPEKPSPNAQRFVLSRNPLLGNHYEVVKLSINTPAIRDIK